MMYDVCEVGCVRCVSWDVCEVWSSVIYEV